MAGVASLERAPTYLKLCEYISKRKHSELELSPHRYNFFPIQQRRDLEAVTVECSSSLP